MFRRVAAVMLPALMLAGATGARAQVATTVSSNVAPAGYGGSLGLLNDGVYPPDGTFFQTNTVYDYASTTYFDFAFAAPTSIGSYNLTVDNNDDYSVVFYNGATQLFTGTISAAQGNVQVSPGGVETFSSSPSRPGTYLASLALGSPVTATNVRIFSSGGDGRYSIGEAEFFAAPAGVPEPATWAMLLIGFGAIGAVMRRRLIASEAAFTAKIRAIAASGDN